MEEDLIVEVWDIFRSYIPSKNMETAANHYVDFLVGKDVPAAVLEALTGYDSHLDQAILLVIGDKEEVDEDEEDNWDYDEDGEAD